MSRRKFLKASEEDETFRASCEKRCQAFETGQRTLLVAEPLSLELKSSL